MSVIRDQSLPVIGQLSWLDHLNLATEVARRCVQTERVLWWNLTIGSSLSWDWSCPTNDNGKYKHYYFIMYIVKGKVPHCKNYLLFKTCHTINFVWFSQTASGDWQDDNENSPLYNLALGKLKLRVLKRLNQKIFWMRSINWSCLCLCVLNWIFWWSMTPSSF